MLDSQMKQDYSQVLGGFRNVKLPLYVPLGYLLKFPKYESKCIAQALSVR